MTDVIEVTATEILEVDVTAPNSVDVVSTEVVSESSPPETVEVVLAENVLEIYAGGNSSSRFLPGQEVNNNNPFVDPTVPPAPTNLTITNGAFFNELTWTVNDYHNHSHVEIWQNTVNDRSTATKVGTSTYPPHKDPVDPRITYYYWVRNLSLSDTASDWNAFSGVPSTAGNDATAIGEMLTDVLTESHLTASLRARLDGIENNATDVAAEIANRGIAIVQEAALRTSEINTALGLEVIARDAAILSAITDESVLRIAAESAITSDVNGLSGQYTVKIDNGGYVTGYGLASTPVDGTPFSEFTVVADKFSIAPVGTDPDSLDGSPFFHLTTATMVNGTLIQPGTYMKAATIHEASITELMVQNASISNAKIKDYIQSSDYSAGSAGWKINKLGDAEFNNGNFRGDITGASGAFSGSLSAVTGTFSGTLTASAVDAVDTLNIRGQAVTFPVSAYTAAAVNIPQAPWSQLGACQPAYGSTVTVQSVVLPAATGAPVQVTFSGLFKKPLWGCWSVITIDRNGTEIWNSGAFRPDSSQNTVQDFISAAVTDTPPAGAVTYTVKAKSQLNDVGAGYNTISLRSLVAMELKR